MTVKFASLVAALGSDALRDHMARRTPLYGSVPEYRQDRLFDFAGLADIFSRRTVPAENLRVMDGRKQLKLDVLGAIDGSWVHPLALPQLARRGVTAVLTNIDRSSERLWEFACDAESWFGDRVSISAVASFGPKSGLELHYDAHNVLIIQLEGEKRWTLYGEAEPGPARRQARPDNIADFPVTQQILMRPGDVLFLPAGLRHQCEPVGKSLHIGVLAIQQSGVRLAEHLLECARADIALNEFVDCPQDARRSAGQAQAFRGRLDAMVDAMDIDAFLAAERLRAARVRRMDWDSDADLADDPQAMAELVLSYWPKGLRGSIRARGAAILASPEVEAIGCQLQLGPLRIGDLAQATGNLIDPALLTGTLRRMASAGFVALRRRS